MTKPIITDETPCFHIDIRYIDKCMLDSHGYEEGRIKYWSMWNEYLDMSEEEANREFAWRMNHHSKHRDLILSATLTKCSDFFTKCRREAQRRNSHSVIDMQSADFRSF